jgi:hypothetical protein
MASRDQEHLRILPYFAIRRVSGSIRIPVLVIPQIPTFHRRLDCFHLHRQDCLWSLHKPYPRSGRRSFGRYRRFFTCNAWPVQARRVRRGRDWARRVRRLLSARRGNLRRRVFDVILIHTGLASRIHKSMQIAHLFPVILLSLAFGRR